jgi:hypothetical protein
MSGLDPFSIEMLREIRKAAEANVLAPARRNSVAVLRGADDTHNLAPSAALGWQSGYLPCGWEISYTVRRHAEGLFRHVVARPPRTWGTPRYELIEAIVAELGWDGPVAIDELVLDVEKRVSPSGSFELTQPFDATAPRFGPVDRTLKEVWILDTGECLVLDEIAPEFADDFRWRHTIRLRRVMRIHVPANELAALPRLQQALKVSTRAAEIRDVVNGRGDPGFILRMVRGLTELLPEPSKALVRSVPFHRKRIPWVEKEIGKKVVEKPNKKDKNYVR